MIFIRNLYLSIKKIINNLYCVKTKDMKFNDLYNSLINEEAYDINKEYVLIIFFDRKVWCKKIITDNPKEELLEYSNTVYNKTGREGKVCTSVDDIIDKISYSIYETKWNKDVPLFTACVISVAYYDSYLTGYGLTKEERDFIDTILETDNEIQFKYTSTLEDIVIDNKTYPTMKEVYDDFAIQSFKGSELGDLIDL